MGGDCLNVGCVPSKAVIRSSRAVADLTESDVFGVESCEHVRADFGAVMERMRRIRSQISEHDSARRFRDKLGVDVYLGEAEFTGPDTVEVGGRTLSFSKAVIATGARAGVPPIEGLAEAGYLTNETVFNLTEKPEDFVVIGGGPIGCEMAQAFRRLGCNVTIIQRGTQFLPREDRDAAALLAESFRKEGITVVFNGAVKNVTTQDGKKLVHVEAEGKAVEIPADQILVAVGRAPNVEGLDLEAAGVEYGTRKGVVVNDKLQTTNKNIYACGDVCMAYKFTHTADAAARIVIKNALFWGRSKLSALTVPWCTYTDPEIAHVGMYERDAKAKGIELDTYTVPFHDVDRAVADGEESGLLKIHVKKGTDKIVGATIVARHAGEIISEITLAIVGQVGLGSIANVIHPYPTQAECIKKAADAYNRTRLTPFVKKLFTRIMAWRR
jgi:pyruvate/2-oxoglutarate dehydrogenase complex dihydrolipoamide dehydrogenase (E3) component